MRTLLCSGIQHERGRDDVDVVYASVGEALRWLELRPQWSLSARTAAPRSLARHAAFAAEAPTLAAMTQGRGERRLVKEDCERTL